MQCSVLRVLIWNFNTVFVTPVRKFDSPGFFFQKSFSRVSICLGLYLRSYTSISLDKQPGKTRLGWFMNNAVSIFHAQARKNGRCVADLPFGQSLGWSSSY